MEHHEGQMLQVPAPPGRPGRSTAGSSHPPPSCPAPASPRAAGSSPDASCRASSGPPGFALRRVSGSLAISSQRCCRHDVPVDLQDRVAEVRRRLDQHRSMGHAAKYSRPPPQSPAPPSSSPLRQSSPPPPASALPWACRRAKLVVFHAIHQRTQHRHHLIATRRDVQRQGQRHLGLARDSSPCSNHSSGSGRSSLLPVWNSSAASSPTQPAMAR